MLGVAAIVCIAAAVVVPVVADSVTSAIQAKEEASASKAQTASDERVSMEQLKADQADSDAQAKAAEELGRASDQLTQLDSGNQNPGQMQGPGWNGR